MEDSESLGQKQNEYVPSLAAGAAGSAWRRKRLTDLIAGAESAGLDGVAEVQALLACVGEHTAHLELLWQKQQDCSHANWWADGEYDAARADRCNEEGMRLLKQALFSDAFVSFTEAIRLCPTSAAYHANRASIALRLGRFPVALQDARCAIARAPGHVRAHLRAAQACMHLGRPEEALELYRQALDLKPQSMPAQAGASLASKLSASKHADREREIAAATLGLRRGLDMASVCPDSAAELLLTADAMLEACPSVEAAKCARVEALILCCRHADALEALKELVPGIDRRYLEAEALWRSGELAQALAAVAAGMADAPGSGKCRRLFTVLNRIEPIDAAAAAALEDGRHADCVALCTQALAVPAVEGASGLQVKLLVRRARSHMALGAHAAALTELTAALALEPAAAACLLARSQVHAALGNNCAAFLDLQRLKNVAPEYPGLFELLRNAAGHAQRKQGGALPGQGPAVSGRMDIHMRELGVEHCASQAGVRQAYKQGAARWHPDKWMHASEAEQAVAKQRFLRVRQAYEALVQLQ